MTGVEPPDGFSALLDKITRDRGCRCASYKASCLRRRVGVRMRARGVHTFEDYAALLDTDAQEYDRLLDALTINVTRLFRNIEVYEAMRRDVVAPLWESDRPRIRVWSAGCASGEEPYSVAALFALHAAEAGKSAQLSRVDVLGTDIYRRSLEAAERGEIEEQDFDETPPDWRSRFFQKEPPFRIDPAVKRLVRFQRHDMLAEAPPRPLNEMIICRNAVIYFDRESQDRLFDSFHACLAPGGFLVLGKVETLLGRARRLFRPLNGRERIFQRVE
jgi:chemotaxis methyl-accepting protein methylase